jgi:hypothetical protein
MTINLDNFWNFIKQWSVGRMLALITVLTWMFSNLKSDKPVDPRTIFFVLLIAVLLEIFELSHNKLKDVKSNMDQSAAGKPCWICVPYSLAMFLSLLGILIFAWQFLFRSTF